VDGFAIGAHGYETYQTCFGEADGVGALGGQVKVFGGGEHGQDWSIEAGAKGDFRAGGVDVRRPIGGGHGKLLLLVVRRDEYNGINDKSRG